MKNVLVVSAVISLLIITSVFSSCKKSDPDPDFPQLIGSWSGNTSQDGPIAFYVDNIKGTLYIMTYKVKIYTSTGYQYFEYTNSEGIASIYNKTFRISLGTGSSGPAFIDGTFNPADMSLRGSFAA